MNRLSRRSLLKGALAGGALAGASGILPTIAGANGLASATLGNGPKYKILEIFLDGGADLWAHAYRVPSWLPYATRLSPGLQSIQQSDWDLLFSAVTDLSQKPSQYDCQHFGYDGNGQVLWGPAFKPLWPQMDRCRMIPVSHHFPFHEGAAPLALTGISLGQPVASSLGAAVNRTRAPGEAPVSFVVPVARSGFGTNTLTAATATGFHGAVNRPVLIACGTNAIHNQLDRDTPPPPPQGLPSGSVARADGDALRNHHNGRYRSMLANAGAQARSRAYDAYDGSLATVEQYADLKLVRLQGVSFALPTVYTAAENPTSTAIHAAVGLLGNGAGHVTVVDDGWDLHDSPDPEGKALKTAKKTYWLAYALRAAIDAQTLNLDQTLVFIHSEFGRRNNGSDHNPEGYPVLLLGGPITSSSIGDQIDGPTTPGGAPQTPNGAFGVAAVRAAVALAAGIDPWQQDMYENSGPWLGSLFNGIGASPAGNFILEQRIFGL